MIDNYLSPFVRMCLQVFSSTLRRFQFGMELIINRGLALWEHQVLASLAYFAA